jgi:hypothetical protein
MIYRKDIWDTTWIISAKDDKDAEKQFKEIEEEYKDVIFN